jgi:cytochrome c biogenesis factor
MWELTPATFFFLIVLPVMLCLTPVWLGLYLTWRDKKKKKLKELLVAWTRNWFLILLGLFALARAVPTTLTALLFYSVSWVMGAIGTLYIWRSRNRPGE